MRPVREQIDAIPALALFRGVLVDLVTTNIRPKNIFPQVESKFEVILEQFEWISMLYFFANVVQ